jgi:hypothetical protein
LFNIPFSLFLLTARYTSAKSFVNSLKSSMNKVDQVLMQDPNFANFMQMDIRESFRQGVKGSGYDALIQT